MLCLTANIKQNLKFQSWMLNLKLCTQVPFFKYFVVFFFICPYKREMKIRTSDLHFIWWGPNRLSYLLEQIFCCLKHHSLIMAIPPLVFIIYLGKLHLPPELLRFLQTPSNVQKLSFRCIKLWFSLILPLPYRKSFAMLILPLTPKLHSSQNDAVLVCIMVFLRNWQSERKPNFDTPK